MIRYEQLEKNDEEPPAVKLFTDDVNAEMAQLEEIIKECGFEITLPDSPDDKGIFSAVIPGDLVGEFSECTYDVDQGLLENEIEKWNQKAVSDTDDDA